jgi:excisionase family DNA binding protein
MNRIERAHAESGWASVKEAAAYLRLSTRQVYRLIDAGVLTSTSVGGKAVVSNKAVIEYAAKNLRLGSVA